MEKDKRPPLGMDSPEDRTGEATAIETGQGFVRHLVCFILVFGVLSVWVSVEYPWDSTTMIGEPAGDERCDVVLVGNSMLGRGVDHDQLSKLLGRRVWKLDCPGSASAWWYLCIKNLVAESVSRPNTVVLFFRDHYLTDPQYRLLGRYAANIRAISQSDEPLIDELAYRPRLGRCRYYLHKSWQPYGIREVLREDLRDCVHGRVADLICAKKRDVRAAMKRAFEEDNMISDISTRVQLRRETEEDLQKFRFNEQLHQSFLPHIIAETKKHKMQLVLVRVKRRRDVVAGDEPRCVRRYMTDLRAYLAEQKVTLIDFTPSPSIELVHYADGDHLTNDGQQKFTELLAGELRTLCANAAEDVARIPAETRLR